MNSGVPWNISDVRPQARETALEAARRCNMSVGDWLSNVIVAQAARQGATRSPSELQARDVEERELAETMERIGRHLEQSAPPSSAAIPEPLPPQSPNAPRVPQPRGPEAYAPRRAMEQPPPAPVPAWSPALEQAMDEIAARQRALDGDASAPAKPASPPPARAEILRPSPDMSGLEKQLRQLTAQIETLHRPNGVESAIKALRNDLAEIGRAVTQAMPRQAIEALEGEIRKLAERVEQNRQSIDRSSIAGMERRIGEMLASLQALTPAERLAGIDEALSGLGRKLDQIVTTKQDAGSLPQFETAISGLRGIVSHFAAQL
jgi:localization factor PodJL